MILSTIIDALAIIGGVGVILFVVVGLAILFLMWLSTGMRN